MPTNIERLRFLIRPSGFLQTRDQLEETQHLVDELIQEVIYLRERVEDSEQYAMDRDLAE